MKDFVNKQDSLGLSQMNLGCPIIIKNNIYNDNRGYFYESFNENVNLITKELFVQDNVSYSKKGVIRGMHYQWDNPMGKLVSCVYGEINDFVVDIRKNSENLGKVYKYNLVSSKGQSLWVPAGFAHGFEALSEEAVVSYKCTSYYNKDGESGINPFDTDLTIPWETSIDNPIISQKDLRSQSFNEYLKDPKF